MSERIARSASIADATRGFIDDHPSIREALAEDIVNFTALARRIQSELALANEEAVTIAARRYLRELSATTAETTSIDRIIGGSRLLVESHVALVRIRDDWELIDRLLAVGRAALADRTGRRLFQLYQGTEAITILCEEGYLSTILPEIPAKARVSVERGLGLIAFRSDREVAETRGVVARMTSRLYRAGINCLETVSVHTDSIFVFRDADMIPAYQVLTELVGGPGAPAPASLGPAASQRGHAEPAGDPRGTRRLRRTSA